MSEQTRTTAVAPRSEWRELLAVFVLLVSGLCCLATSWRCWPDPLVDAGHQLYVAWRLSEGDVLNRDLAYLYGPLSAHVNALLYLLFGSGMMVLVAANLVVYTAIAVLCYRMFRAVYGVVGAVTAVAVFIWIFSFNQLIVVGNYTYALPYAHESTHGMVVVLALIPVSARWSERKSRRYAFSSGLLGGLTLVLKPEFMLVAAMLMVVVAVVRSLRGQRFGVSEITAFLAAGAAPTLCFVGWFWRQEPLPRAFEFASRAWWAVVVDSAHSSVWGRFSGTDALLPNLQRELLAGALWIGGAALIWFGGWMTGRGKALGAVLCIAPSVAAFQFSGRTSSVGVGLPSAMLALLIWRVTVLLRRRRSAGVVDQQDVLTVMLVLVAAVMLARMVLQARIYHFGFYQAALAAMVASASATVWLPQAAKPSRRGAALMLACSALVIASAAYHAFARSSSLFALRTLPVGAGRDTFFAYAPNVEPMGWLVGAVVDELKSTPEDTRVFVVPEGLMINYLARRRSPVPEWALLDVTLRNGGEDRILHQLQESPPEYVVFISRDLREHGVVRFGGSGQYGEALVAWITAHYEPVRSWGADPFDPSRRGAVVLRYARRASHAISTLSDLAAGPPLTLRDPQGWRECITAFNRRRAGGCRLRGRRSATLRCRAAQRPVPRSATRRWARTRTT